MTNENKTRLLNSFLKMYVYTWESEYIEIMHERLKYFDDDYVQLGKIFTKHQDFIIDFFTSEINIHFKRV